jgi:hypothetical protein
MQTSKGFVLLFSKNKAFFFEKRTNAATARYLFNQSDRG